MAQKALSALGKAAAIAACGRRGGYEAKVGFISEYD